MPIDLAVWGKSRNLPRPYPLAGHLIDTATIAGALWDQWLTPAQRRVITRGLGLSAEDESHARDLVACWAGLHDLGKATPAFQFQPSAPASSAVLPEHGLARVADLQPLGHDVATQLTVPALLLELWDTPSRGAQRAIRRVGQILGGHHGIFWQPTSTTDRGVGDSTWDEQRRALVREVDALSGHPGPPLKVDAGAALLITGVVMVADWLASQESHIRSRLPGHVPSVSAWLAEHASQSMNDGLSAVARAGLTSFGWRDLPFEEAFAVRKPRAFQRSLLAMLPSLVRGPGLLLITVPTGEGKTEAALAAAKLMGERSGTPGLFVALPTMATADQMYRRVAEYATRCLDRPAGLTLAHSMAWLNKEYAAGTASLGEVVGDQDPDHCEPSRTAAAEWLHGRKRTLLAPLSVGTIDQVLTAIVRGKHNALRLLGLSGKVLVIDEVHSYDAYMHALLRRLLHWLGVLRVPVVLLSATLAGRVAQQLVEDYLGGAGVAGQPIPRAPYPGWLHADVGSGRCVANQVEVENPWTLAVDPHPVRAASGDDPTGRSAALRTLLGPVTTDGGCAAVVCNTVADAQQTYRALREWFDTLPGPPELHLFHARFPAWRRAEITAEVEARFGKDRPNTGAAVLVATQVVEQSLDLDFDLMVSDLAPLALLLQRAGRCWRHHGRPRPAWSVGPRIAVLTPVDADGRLAVPVRWSGVYSASLLMRTHELLARLSGPIAVPDQVQDLVDAVYAEVFADTDDPERLAKADLERLGGDAAAEGIADMATVPMRQGMMSLADWSAGEIDEELLRTRLGADSVRLVCCYLDDHGDRWLDADRRTGPLPETGSGPKGRFTRDEVRAVMANTVPVPGSWARDLGPDHEPPATWADNPLLRHLRLLTLSPDQAGTESVTVGQTLWSLSHHLGLVNKKNEARSD